MNGVATTGPQDPAANEVNTESNGKSRGEIPSASAIPATAATNGSGSSRQATAQPAGSAENAADELPRKRRGILLGTRPAAASPAAADDAKSLSWMASQAVKALNAVKASQMEQAQALKARGDDVEDGQAPAWHAQDTELDAAEPAQPSPEDQLAALRAHGAAGELSPDAASRAVQFGTASIAPLPASPSTSLKAASGQPEPAPVVSPVETVPESAVTAQVPAMPRAATTPRVAARLALLLGVLAVFSYTGYRHWFAADRANGDAPATTASVLQPAGPAADVNLMAPPAISVVAAPQPAASPPESAAALTEAAPTPAPESPAGATAPAGPVTEGTPMPDRVVDVPAAATPERSEPAALAAGLQQGGVVGDAPQPPPANPASAATPQVWQPAAAPATPAPADEVDMTARHAVAPPPVPAAEADGTASRPAPAAPAARPQYPASGYGYYPPSSSWQPYYRPGYPQAPAHR